MIAHRSNLSRPYHPRRGDPRGRPKHHCRAGFVGIIMGTREGCPYNSRIPPIYCEWQQQIISRPYHPRRGDPRGRPKHHCRARFVGIIMGTRKGCPYNLRMPYRFITAASSMNFFRPASVSGWLASCLMTEKGIVAMSAPIIEASTTCCGWRTLATITSVR